MNNSFLFLKTIVLLVILLFHAGSLLAESKKELPGLEWERHLGDDNFRYTAKAMTFSSKEAGLLIAGTSSLAGSTGEAGSFWLWKVNENGDKIQEIQIKSPHDSRILSGSYPYIKSLASLDNGDVLLLIEFIGDQPSLLKLDRDGKVLFVKVLAKSGSGTVISKIIPTDDKNFILIGHKFKDALVLKIDPLGNELWRKTIDHGKTDLFVDGLPTAGGGSVLLGNSGTYRQLFLGPSDVWVVKMDAGGNIQSEETFPGRYGSVTRGHKGDYAIVYDKSDSMGQDIRVRVLNSDLKESREYQLLSVNPGFARFKIASVPTGGFIIAGSKRGSLWVARINNEGKEIWNVWEESIAMSDTIRSWNLGCDELTSLNNRFFILSSVYSENKNRQLNTKVGLIKFTQK